MKRFSLLIAKYLLQVILPYCTFAWLLLSVILFVQQAGRFADIFFGVNIPTNLVWQLTLALVPSVIAFTCPMAVLVGVIIGLAKMQGDSELVAIRAAGVGNLQITIPIIGLGILLSIFAFLVNLYGVPLASSLVRQVALKTAIYKLESPIEPGVFNTDIAGYTIYVKKGDIASGSWQNIFIHNEDEKTGTMRLITSSNGRIDSNDQASELVLENATVSTLSKEGATQKFASENVGEIRFAVRTSRAVVVERLSKYEMTPEELGLAELSEYASTKEGKERIEAEILWQRRIVLSITPLIFCLLGSALILRFNRGGRGLGIFLAFVSLVFYYLVAFFGEQLARTGQIAVPVASLLSPVVSFLLILWFYRSSSFGSWRDFLLNLKRKLGAFFQKEGNRLQRRSFYEDLTTGIRDFDLIFNLLSYFLLTLAFFVAVFLIFTAFELWKFAGVIDGGITLLIKYLFFRLPSACIELAPSALMIATLATYVIKSRQNEIVTWTSAGQSIYRLLLPCFLLMAAIGVINWQIQERILPRANQIQDDLRDKIRSTGTVKPKKLWVASADRIYSFETNYAASDNVIENITIFDLSMSMSIDRVKTGSDSDRVNNRVRTGSGSDWVNNRVRTGSGSDWVNNQVRTGSGSDWVNNQVRTGSGSDWVNVDFHRTPYNRDKANITKLRAIYHADTAVWEREKIILQGNVEKNILSDGMIKTETVSSVELPESLNPFLEIRKKPSHLTMSETAQQIENSDSEFERRNFAVALEKKRSTAFLPLIIALFTAPFALSLSRKGKVVTVGYAVGLWLLYMGTTSIFDQLGMNGHLSPAFAVWAPLLAFSMLGVYFLSRVKT